VIYTLQHLLFCWKAATYLVVAVIFMLVVVGSGHCTFALSQFITPGFVVDEVCLQLYSKSISTNICLSIIIVSL
jgi:hypothetical protein